MLKKALLVFVVIIFASVFTVSCMGSDDEESDGDQDEVDGDSTSCPIGSRRCEGTTTQYCNGENWIDDSDCAAQDQECIDGFCGGGSSFAYLHNTGELVLEFDEGQQYMIAPFALDKGYANIPYSIATNSDTAATKKSAKANLTSVPDAKLQARIEKLYHKAEFDKLIRERSRTIMEKNLSSGKVRTLAKTKSSCQSSANCGKNEICEDGQCLSKLPMHFFGWEYNEDITAEVLAKGDKCALLIDSRDTEAFTQNQVDYMLDMCDNLILPRDHFFFGKPSYGNDEDLGDYNGDGLLHVMITNLCNKEQVWGFFYSGDFWPDDDEDYPSNERDIIYVAIPETDEAMVSVMATIAHEYQHLIHFVRKTLGPSNAGENRSQQYEEVWLDEGFAHLAEDLVGFGTDNVAMAYDYFRNMPSTSLQYDGDTLNQRSMAMLLFRYLFEQAGGVEYDSEDPSALVDNGGAAFLRSMIASDKYGEENVSRTSGITWENIMLNWLTALTLDSTGISDDDRFNYQSIIEDPFTGYEIGVATRGERMTSWGTTLELTGPGYKSFNGNLYEDEVESWAAGFVKIEGLDNETGLNFSSDAENMNFAIIRVQ